MTKHNKVSNDKESKYINNNTPTIGLALGGGGALGLAHIGVIKALEKNNIKVSKVAGTSMGAIVGALYSYGLNVKDMTEIVSSLSALQFIDVNIDFKGLLNGRGSERLLAKYLPKDATFEQLNKEFACVAVDILTGKEVVFDKGPLFKPVRASYSVPLIFSPVKMEDMVLVDGGIINNYPDDVVKQMGADIIIGVNVVNNFPDKPKVSRLSDVLYLSAITTQLFHLKSKKKYADVYIAPNLGNFKQYNFNKTNALKIINIGYKETLKHMDEILTLIDKSKNINQTKNKGELNG